MLHSNSAESPSLQEMRLKPSPSGVFHTGKWLLKNSSKRWFYAVWLVLIGCFAVLHALNLRADFPNHSPWVSDWAKYTDEGWYSNAAVRAHLLGNWYLPGDFNPAVAVPVLPFLEWLLFSITGVTIEAARGLAVACFFANLVLSYTLLRSRGPRWMPLLAVTLLVTSPFLYCFSRLAILEQLLTVFTLGAINLAVRLTRMRRPVWTAVIIGLLFTLMMLTKTTALFLLPAVGWAILLPLWHRRGVAVRCALAAAVAFAATFGLWMALVAGRGLMGDFKYYFFVNNYPRPAEFYWPLLSLWWSFHGGLWIDHILFPLAGLVVLGAAVAWRAPRARKLLLDPVFGTSIWAIGGYILFMTYQNHPQPRYFAVVSFFCVVLVAQAAQALLGESTPVRERGTSKFPTRLLGWSVIGLAALAAGLNGVQTLDYAAHPEYTFVNTAERLTRYIDEHPNGNRLLVSISGDQITLATHLPALCDDFGTPSPAFPGLAEKLAYYQPGWWATWNEVDPGTLEDIHTHFSLEQVASFRAFDDEDRNLLVLFKLHPLPGGKARSLGDKTLLGPLPDDKIDIPVE